MNLVGTVETQNEVNELEFITKVFIISMRYRELGKIARKQRIQKLRNNILKFFEIK